MTFPEELKKEFRNLVTGRCGLYFRDHDLRNLEDAVTARMKSRGLSSAAAYYNHLTTSAEKEDEFRELLNLLTINHTYFLRNEPHFRALREKVLPEIIRKKTREQSMAGGTGKPRIRIWSAGCSTGEEPYSMAMVIRELIGNPDEWDVEIYAADVSTDALKKAKAGLYSEHSMRLVGQEYRQKYFVERRGSRGKTTHEIQSDIKDMVNLAYRNLVNGAFPSDFDIILCRNVVMYFDLPTMIRVMKALHSSLADDGYLFMGYSESLQSMPDRFRMEEWNDAIFYRKVVRERVMERKAPRPAVKEAEEILEKVSRAELEAERAAEEKKARKGSREMESLLVQIIKSMHLKEYEKALSLVEQAWAIDREAVAPHYLAAEIHVNQGKFDEAKKRLSTILDLDVLFAPAHYLFGSVYREEGSLEQAKKSLTKALYLDKGFVMAHFELANVYIMQGRIEDAIRGRRNTLKVLERISPGDTVAYSGGFKARSLRNVCTNSIEWLKTER